MNSAIFLFIFVGLYSSCVSASRQSKDVTPEDAVIEEFLASLEEQQKALKLPHSPGSSSHNPGSPSHNPEFPSHNPGSSSHNPSVKVEYNYSLLPPHQSSFAVNPSDPRYYKQEEEDNSVAEDAGHKKHEKSIADKGRSLQHENSVEAGNEVFHRDLKSPAEETDAGDLSLDSNMISSQERGQPVAYAHVSNAESETENQETTDIYFIAVVAGCSAAAVGGIIAAGICWYRLQKNAKAAADVEYPAYGITGPNKEISPTGDRTLAHSAQMYHFQHQKQQMLAMENVNNERQGSTSDVESEEENEEGDYTVYECPGLAPTGEMEVKNPLFQDDPTPATPANHVTQHPPEKQDQDHKNKEHSEK